MVHFERLEWHRSGENESFRMNKEQRLHLLADPPEKTARIAESSPGLAKDWGLFHSAGEQSLRV
jgi:hypothetical protein